MCKFAVAPAPREEHAAENQCRLTTWKAGIASGRASIWKHHCKAGSAGGPAAASGVLSMSRSYVSRCDCPGSGSCAFARRSCDA